MKQISTNLLATYLANKNKVILATPEYFKAFKAKMEAVIKQDFDMSDDSMPDMSDETPYINCNGIAVIDFCGVTVPSCSPMEALVFGLVSLEDFCEDLEQAVNDETVTSVVVNFNSGGGYTGYGDETCEIVKTLSAIKPIYAFCAAGLMCSMAYKVASNMSAIIASPSALVGSIGTYCEYMTYNGASPLSPDGITVSNLQDLGVTVTTFQGGTDKTIGSEYIALNEAQKQQISAEIQTMTTDFRNMVSENRGGVNIEYMQGQPFTGKEAMELDTNLIDGCLNNLKELFLTITDN